MTVEIINRPTIQTSVTKRVFLEGSDGLVGALTRVVGMHRQYFVQKWRDQSLTHEPLTMMDLHDIAQLSIVGVSISNPAFCTISKEGGLTDVLMWLHKRIEEKGGGVGNVQPLVQSFLVSISS
jgi:hypothetical protein